MAGTYLNNFCYLFVPFTTEKLEQFGAFRRSFASRKGWTPMETENRYLHRYVAEKLTRNDPTCRYHFRLDREFAQTQGLQLGRQWYGTEGKKYKGETDVHFDFLIANVELFIFQTAIGIMAFELRFRDDDPKKIAAAQYYLRKITAEKICQLGVADSPSESFADIAKRLLISGEKDIPLDFFFYATHKNEKANFLTYVDVPEEKDYSEELFHLKWCYHDGFVYTGEESCEDNENYMASPNIIWGISVSAAVCLVRRDDHQRNFVEKSFQGNFRHQYLLTYTLLLHQKYMMYLFLTKMSNGLEGNVGQLEKYKEFLYDFETQYMFAYISEVPQYQRLYSRVRRIFALEELFRDVQEPLLQLTEIQKQNAEEIQRKHEYRINTALTTLSMLTIVSALTDASGITANLDWLISNTVSRIIQLVALAGVGGLSIYLLIRLFFLRKR